MNKLHFALCCLSAALSFSTATATSTADSRWYLETGVTHFSLSGADYAPLARAVQRSGPPAFLFAQLPTQSRKTNAPFVAVGSTVMDWLGVRLSYHFLDKLTTPAGFYFDPTKGVIVGGDVILKGSFRPLQMTEKLSLVTLAPELKWKVASHFALTLSPALNWVSSEQSVYFDSIKGTKLTEHHQHEFTFGVAVGALWSFAERWDLGVNYGYADLNPSGGREARLLSGSLRRRF